MTKFHRSTNVWVLLVSTSFLDFISKVMDHFGKFCVGQLHVHSGGCKFKKIPLIFLVLPYIYPYSKFGPRHQPPFKKWLNTLDVSTVWPIFSIKCCECKINPNTVPNMNKIHWFIPNISLQTHQHFVTKPQYIVHASNPYCGWLLYQIWIKSTLCFLGYHKKHITFLKNIAIITQIWHGAKCTFTWISNT